ncbi:MAG: LAGLIDADG family homing endonuclease [Gammaproteobacteria bacterium]|nr:LAGLIDADG family homing endonuclease [Gammaproteobacteria bacterium]
MTRPAEPGVHDRRRRRTSIIWSRTADGYEIKATKWHDFYTRRGKIKLKDLEVGDELLVQSGKGAFGTEGSTELGVLLGLVTGDGHFTNRGNDQEAVVVNFWNEELKLADGVAAFINTLIGTASTNGRAYNVAPTAVAERNHAYIRSVILTRVLEQYGFTKESKLRVPEVIWRGSGRLRSKATCSALFQADGTVNISGRRQSCSVRLSSSYESLLKDVQHVACQLRGVCAHAAAPCRR